MLFDLVVERRSGEEVVRHFRMGEERGSRRSGTARRLRTSTPKLTTEMEKSIAFLPSLRPDVPLPQPRLKPPSVEVLAIAMEFQLFVSTSKNARALLRVRLKLHARADRCDGEHGHTEAWFARDPRQRDDSDVQGGILWVKGSGDASRA